MTRWGAHAVALTLALALSCTATRVSLPVKGDSSDDDDDSDETPVPCDDASMCAGLEDRKLCHPIGFCVECIQTSDCADGFTCDREYECERSAR